MIEQEGFIIYPTFRVEGEKAYVYLFGRLKDGRSFCTKNSYSPYFYIKTSDLKKVIPSRGFKHEETKLKNFDEEELTKIILKLPSQVTDLKKSFEEKRIECYESDIKFEYRFMMDKALKGSILIKGKISKNNNVTADAFFEEPEILSGTWKTETKDLRILSLDIETSMDAKQLYCISLVSNDEKLKKVLIISDKKHKYAEEYKNEKELFVAFKKELLEYDPDIITGWNLIDFDLKIIEEKMNRLGVGFDLGRTKDKCKLRIVESFMMDSKADFPGRIVLDGIHLLKTSFIKLDDYKLGTAAAKFTNKKKLIEDENKGEEIEQSYKKNPQKLIDYNLLDSELVIEIIEKSGAMQLTIQRSLLTGMPLDRVRASIASLDSLYLRKLRERGYAAPNSKFSEREERTVGGFVMEPKPGIYNYVIVFDFKSLYPSLMRTFNIDPLMYRGNEKNIANKEKEELIIAPNGASFSKVEGILPEILEQLWDEREIARKKKDELTRWAIKILMNSMYGVLANPNCRFYNTEIANAITSFARHMIQSTADLVRQKGYEVIYGDTDSCFVYLNVKTAKEAKKIGEQIEKEINDYYDVEIQKKYGVKSHLELEFEKIFVKFFMPKVRGSEEGAKKRYAGLLLKNGTEEMDFTGLEFVRRDWTEVSKKFQLELLDLVFHDKEVKVYIKKFIEDLLKGKYDELLIYRKALRKDTEEYTKTTPPHVKAARLLDKITSNIIDYIMTNEGPVPVQLIEKDKEKKTGKYKIDYEHYIDKQIKPLADAILYFYDASFDDVMNGSSQRSLGDW
ncbi:MAG: DNA polymerase II [Candidatus Nanoarchaeia archaeon]